MSDLDRPIYSANQVIEIEQKAYTKGRADAIEEYVAILQKQLDSYEKHHELLEKLIEQLKEKKYGK